MQCEKAICELVCPTDALSKNPQTGAMIVNKNRCIGCGACSYACPFGACFVDHNLRTAVVCDQCDGDSLCVELCPTSALNRIRADEINITLKQSAAQRLLNGENITNESIVSSLTINRNKS
jgi:Fe-S-cluster-containing hydrogenase component 2